MFAKGNLNGSGPNLIAYLLRGQEGEQAELVSARGFEQFGPNLVDAAELMQELADTTTRVEYAWFHTSTRLPADERLAREQWEEIFDREEKRLGFSGHARLCSFHINEETGEMHGHAAWFRLDPETGLVHDPGLYKLRLKELSRECEIDYGLRRLDNERHPHDRAPAASRDEQEEARRLGIDEREVRAAILECLEQADSGKAFKAALEECGFELANGNRRDVFVVVDQEGGHHALNKKLTGHTLAEMRDRLGDLDRTQLPSVAEAQEMQRERQAAVEASPEAITPENVHEMFASAAAIALGRDAPQVAEIPGAVPHNPVPEIEREFKTVAAQVAEPAAPIFDRDAAEREWMEKLEAAALANSAQKSPQEPRQRPEAVGEGNTADRVEATQAPSEAPPTAYPHTRDAAPVAEPIASEALAETVHTAADYGAKVGEGFLRGIGRMFVDVIEAIADIFPAPRLAPDQAERAERASMERAEARSFADAERENEAQRWAIIENRRQQQDEVERDPRLAAMMQLHAIPTSRTQEREQEPEQERERER